VSDEVHEVDERRTLARDLPVDHRDGSVTVHQHVPRPEVTMLDPDRPDLIQGPYGGESPEHPVLRLCFPKA
jgi:hypothetical protein